MDQREREFLERLLGAAIEGPVTITGAADLGSDFAPVRRVWLDRDIAGLGHSVIVKTRRHGGSGWGYDVGNLRREYASLMTLSHLGLDIAPGVVAADDRAGVLVLRDLGTGPTVEGIRRWPAGKPLTPGRSRRWPRHWRVGRSCVTI